ncbi:SRA stem-loop-interacting RNA-binding protein, mitochondrial isoform X1 [Alligator sinensis]|uniref:SRA stem-loop-interacting RNA-binding protein, mitochondrial isoform X1 n=1 Tax=Alligator sinensis TaxID=38654 RepID=A0A3Q0H172_ALLSI|nr:SRA stem-loop-interacting RNA-binding protein, mitochondrial isoform X1 [Alligator sinensis]
MAPRRRLYMLFVRGLPWTVARDEISQYFSQFGYVKKCSLPFVSMSPLPCSANGFTGVCQQELFLLRQEDETGFHKGYCWIQFNSQSSTNRVLKNSHTLEGAQLQVLKSRQGLAEVNTLLADMD